MQWFLLISLLYVFQIFIRTIVFQTESHLMVGAGDDEATESEVMDAACDVVPLLSKATSQPEFSQLFAEFLPLLRNRIVCLIFLTLQITRYLLEWVFFFVQF